MSLDGISKIAGASSFFHVYKEETEKNRDASTLLIRTDNGNIANPVNYGGDPQKALEDISKVLNGQPYVRIEPNPVMPDYIKNGLDLMLRPFPPGSAEE
jgi:hypothetical protein